VCLPKERPRSADFDSPFQELPTNPRKENRVLIALDNVERFKKRQPTLEWIVLVYGSVLLLRIVIEGAEFRQRGSGGTRVEVGEDVDLTRPYRGA